MSRKPEPATVESIKLQGVDESESRRYLKPVYRCGCFGMADGSWSMCEYHKGYDDAASLTPAASTTKDDQ